VAAPILVRPDIVTVIRVGYLGQNVWHELPQPSNDNERWGCRECVISYTGPSKKLPSLEFAFAASYMFIIGLSYEPDRSY
jgi:hypothetical protein